MDNDVLKKLNIPAIGLLVSSVLNGLIGFLTTASGIMRLSGRLGEENLPTSEAERFGFLFGTFLGYGVGFLSIVIAPIVFYGALKMMKGEKYGIAKTASILSVIPLICCFPLSVVFGIWALSVLSKPEVKAFFRGDFSRPNLPPQPPRGW
jgi:ABC-type phosphate transport system permease subunit